VALTKVSLPDNKLTGKPTTITSPRTKLSFLGTIPDFSSNFALEHLYLQNNELTGK
jgi:hypothetical protein